MADEATAALNGEVTDPTPPTEEAKKLLGKDYASAVVASLGETRMISDSFIRDSIGAFNPDHVSDQDLRRMRGTDSMIKMGLHYSKAPIIRAERDFQCEDPRIAAAVKEAVEAVLVPTTKIFLNSFDFGRQAAVKQFEYGKLEGTYEDKNGDVKPIWPDKSINPVVIGIPIPIPPENTRPHLKKGRFDGIDTPFNLEEPSNRRNQQNQHIPVEWSLWVVNEFEEEFRNWYGVSRIKTAYRAWWSYWFTWHMRDRHAEMDADPALQVWYPPGTYRDPETGEMRNRKDDALVVGQQLRGGATIAWPSDVHIADDGKVSATPLWRAEFLKGGENLDAFNKLINELRIEKLRACLVPEEALTEALRGTGSRATSGNRVEIFVESLELTALYLDTIWNKYLIRPFVVANFGADAPPCRMKTVGFQQEDLSLVTELIKIAFNLDPNALPIKFEELLRRANLPVYSKDEQQEREQAIADAERERAEAEIEAQDVATLPGEPANVPGPSSLGPPSLEVLPGGADQPGPGNPPQQDPAFLQQQQRVAQAAGGAGLGLAQAGPRSAPDSAHREHARRLRNVAAINDRLQDVAVDLYGDAFEAAASALEERDGDLHLGIRDVVREGISWVTEKIEGMRDQWQSGLQGEFASMYHAAGMAELRRLGLSGESWDVGRDEVQEWAREHAGERVKTISRTVVEQHVRPWLTKALSQAGYGDAPDGVPVDTLELAAQLRDKFAGYPQWMAERLVRTESMTGYNLSAADMWERVGVIEVQEYDGLGGKTGQTDEHCLARNGAVVSLDQFRQDTVDEHPNGTLGGIPVTVDISLMPLNPRPTVTDPAMSLSIYAVDREGFILSEEETGRALAEDD